MLLALVFVIFIIENQTVAKDSFVSTDLLLHATQQATKLQQQANELISKKLSHDLEGYRTQKGCFAQQSDEKKPKCVLQKLPASQKKAGQILVFVSFSIPEVSLKALSQEVQKYNAVLVMRGLYQDSFAKTAQKLQELGVTVDINPELFETHHITSVPTFLLMQDDHPVYRLKGNVTLDFVAQKFEEQNVKEVS